MHAAVTSAGYRLAEAVTLHRGIRRRINGDVLRLPARWCRYYPAVYEPAKHDFLVRRCRPGSAVLDLGAHLGVFTVAMARAVGPTGVVIAVEPTTSTRDALTRTVALNGLQAVVTVRPEVVTDRTGVSLPFLTTADELSNANRVVRSGDAADGAVRSTTIDELAADVDRPVSCIKLDIEGAELAALRGARHTIDDHRPALAIEIHPRQLADAGDSSTEVWSWLLDAGYDVTRGGEPVARDWFVEQPGCFEIQALAQ